MALQKSVSTDQGISADYHRIDFIRMQSDDKKLFFDVQLYIDAAARSGGGTPIKSSEYCVEGAEFDTYFAPAVLDTLNQNPQERAYAWLKTQTTPVDFTTGTTDV